MDCAHCEQAERVQIVGFITLNLIMGVSIRPSFSPNHPVLPMTRAWHVHCSLYGMEYLEIEIDELDELILNKTPVVIDMRDTNSYMQARIRGAVPADDSTIRRIMRNRERPVLVYCYHGISSRDFAGMLTGMGVQEVYSLAGGWQAVAGRSNQPH